MKETMVQKRAMAVFLGISLTMSSGWVPVRELLAEEMPQQEKTQAEEDTVEETQQEETETEEDTVEKTQRGEAETEEDVVKEAKQEETETEEDVVKDTQQETETESFPTETLPEEHLREEDTGLAAGSEPESEVCIETGNEPETAAEGEAESESGSEAQSGLQSEAENEPGSEAQSESESETENEAENEPGSEAQSEPESETENETENESESESESETESETAFTARTRITVKDIHVDTGSLSREYDGTDRVKLLYSVSPGEIQEENRPVPEVVCSAHLAGTDAGEQKVIYSFSLSGEQADLYELQVEETELTVQILPRQLTVTLPDGWLLYHRKPVMDEVYLTGEILVTGFLEDEEGETLIPPEFELPGMDLDPLIVQKDSPMFDPDGKEAVYQHAIILLKAEDGSVTGNPGRNHVFREETEGGSIRIKPNAPVEGKDYVITGEEGRTCPGSTGSWWAAPGSSLSVVPLGKSGFDQGFCVDGITGDGVIEDCLKLTDAEGRTRAQSQSVSLSWELDASVPAPEICLAGGQVIDGIRYANDSVRVTITVPEDRQSGTAGAMYTVRQGMEMTDCRYGQSCLLTEEGTYQIMAEAVDRVGNRAGNSSEQIIVDRTDPQLLVEGIRDGGQTNGTVGIRLSCHDEHYRRGSFHAVLTGSGGQAVNAAGTAEEDGNGAVLTFPDIPHSREYDDRYTLVVSAEDQAGNRSEETMSFLVNRFGSIYRITGGTGTDLDNYYHRSPFDVCFSEENISEVTQASALMTHEGNVTTCDAMKYADSTCADGKMKYTYCLPATLFSGEGAYEVLLMSTDSSGNSGDSLSQQQAVSFAIDRTAPECLFTGIEDGGIYQTEQVWMCAEVRDNLCLSGAGLYLDDKAVKTFSMQELNESGGMIKYRLDAADQWRKVRIEAEDAAGNRCSSKELAVFISSDLKNIPEAPAGVQTKTMEMMAPGEDPADGLKGITGPDHSYIPSGEGHIPVKAAGLSFISPLPQLLRESSGKPVERGGILGSMGALGSFLSGALLFVRKRRRDLIIR